MRATDRPRRRRERGSALVLAILILFAMLALGLLAMRSTTQNIASAGNVRLQKQARYVAESGLYSVLTLFNSASPLSGALIAQWQAARIDGNQAVVVVDDRGGARVLRVGPDGQPVGGPVYTSPAPVGLPAFISSGPNPLGRYGETSGLVSSFEVTVEGFQLWGPPPGNDITANREDSSDYCMLHLTSRGYVAGEAVGSDRFEAARDDVRFAEYALRAGMVFEVLDGASCQAL